MGEEVRENLRRLVRIQETSRKIYFLEEMIRDIPKNYSANQESYDERTRLIEKKKLGLEEIARGQAHNERERQDLQAKAAQEDGRIKKVTTQREYEAIEHEVRAFQQRMSDLETEYLKMEESRERLEKEVAELLDGYEEEGRKLAAESAEVSGRVDKAQAELADLAAVRDEIVPDLDEELYDQFLRVVNNKQGIGITPMEGTTCGSCRMNLPPQMVNDIQKCRDYFRCPYCSRFVFHKDLLAGEAGETEELQKSKQARQPRSEEG